MERLSAVRAPQGRGHEFPMGGAVLTYAPDRNSFSDEHERATRAGIASRLAVLKGFRFGGVYDPGTDYPSPVYLVPNDVLVEGDVVTRLGIVNEHDLFGGIVPAAFVSTKAITHGLVSPDAAAPAGWSHAFADRVRDAVHHGFSVFSPADARKAAAQLLRTGPVRVKAVRATGGRGQAVISRPDELEPLIERIAHAEWADCGLVLEENLTDVTTYSIGQVRVAELVATYWGTQRLTADRGGEMVYGGSDLFIVRGSFDALLGKHLSPEVRTAAMQARIYDEAAFACFPSLVASRRNYDIARGRNAQGEWRSGVLEQSWRLGGASTAEIAALEAFRVDPTLMNVHASSVEVYAQVHDLPRNAIVYFRGVDDSIGPITKYAVVHQS